jgi:hypothetical protein
MAEIKLHLPDPLYRCLSDLAKRDGVSIDRLIISAVAEKVSALRDDEYLLARGARGHRDQFDEVLTKVPDRKPVSADEL